VCVLDKVRGVQLPQPSAERYLIYLRLSVRQRSDRYMAFFQIKQQPTCYFYSSTHRNIYIVLVCLIMMVNCSHGHWNFFYDLYNHKTEEYLFLFYCEMCLEIKSLKWEKDGKRKIKNAEKI